MRQRGSIAKRLARLLRPVGLLFAAGGIVVLGMQGITWFRAGVWTNPSLFDLWLWLGNSYSIGAMNSANRIALLILDLPLAPTVLAAALVLLFIAKQLEK